METKYTKQEVMLLAKIVAHGIKKNSGFELTEVSRLSDKEFDINYNAYSGENYTISAWLPLASIHAFVTWPSRHVAILSDYPKMAMEGDWSGIRDSSRDKIWNIFDLYVDPSK